MSDQARILIVEDDDSLREALCDTLELSGYQTVAATNGNAALQIIESEDLLMVISDVQMPAMDGHELLQKVRQLRPDLPFVLVTAYGSIEQAVGAIQSGATDYLVKPFDGEVLVEMVSRFAGTKKHIGLIAEDGLTLNVVRLADRVAPTDATVMITGESGTGKEVFARYIHDNSSRASKPFVAINCAAIPETMLESILFGFEKGAFTGAYKSREGKFEQANGGTLLLDEISEMDISLQAKLLRVLQEKEVERLGGTGSISLDVRVLATSNRNLKQAVEDGKFREDLFYRLNVFPLRIPSLHRRRDDICALAKHFIKAFSTTSSLPKLTTSAEQLLLAHAWRGNVRELENVIHRAVILGTGQKITPEDLVFETEHELEVPEEAAAQMTGESLVSDMKVQEQHLIVDALRAENGNKQCAAQRLGISPRTLRYKIAKYRKEGICIPELASA